MNISSYARRLLQAADATVFGTTLGLGTAAYKNTGTSGNNVPLLDGANTWSGAQTLNTANTFFGTSAGAATILEVGDTSGTTGVAGIDFHTSTTSVDYNVRVIASGNSALGAGTLTITAATLALGSTALTGSSVTLTSYLARGAPVTKTADFTVATTENNLINNKSGSTCTVTLPTASSFTGREILINNIQAQTVVSASSNVVPRAGGAAGTAILAATAGAWGLLISDGTNWKIMAGS
ncbi:hypothetical protein EN802_32445 [bacterium M00.F.Ca.ET.159.01.1.1]|uniref:hypothetical protein n=1 Tax=Mesorhizobium sp. M2D.F.Ca.ET.223.01.1.1 TaxID=2563940 RepID=UPI001091DBD3|nr:hypothetical protein [Mesorhizobium sp. M2D.F.Ca.ET.223.01.1.1]TGT64500.1 hypothetical protein EN802_32445 [bacterium M00.F.Ca.ET.159.01.1.1]TGT79345.1 hypothetical protein EN800_31785 [bacterium M00.F.Ca.ET.157.01.1.1]